MHPGHLSFDLSIHLALLLLTAAMPRRQPGIACAAHHPCTARGKHALVVQAASMAASASAATIGGGHERRRGWVVW